MAYYIIISFHRTILKTWEFWQRQLLLILVVDCENNILMNQNENSIESLKRSVMITQGMCPKRAEISSSNNWENVFICYLYD